MSRTIRPLALLAGLAGAVALSACTPVHTGAAAVVGSDRIATGTLEQLVARGLANPQAAQQLGADRPAYQRQVLGRLVNHDVLLAAAATQGVTVSDGDVDARLAQYAAQLGGAVQLQQQAAQSGIAPQDLRGYVRDLVLTDAVGDRLTAGVPVAPQQIAALYAKGIASYDQVLARHILVKTQAEAQAILRAVRADPAQFATLAASRSLDTGSKDKGGQLAPAGRGAFVKPFENALFTMKPGEYRIVHTEFGWHVVNLLARHTTTLAQATPDLRRQALQTRRQVAVSDLLRATAARLHVSVNPRFGAWDPRRGTVVQAVTGVSSPAPGGSPAAARTTP